jgi:predicted Rossmann-fold nucleotide-binding protein
LEWMKKTLVKEKTISKEDLALFYVTDDPAEVVKLIKSFDKTKRKRFMFRIKKGLKK